MLLVITVVALAISLYSALTHNSKLSKLNDELSAEAGTLVIDDKDLMYVRELESYLANLWKFRVHIPEGQRGKLRLSWYQGGKLEREKLSTIGFLDLKSETEVFWLQLRQQDSKWYLSRTTRKSDGGSQHGRFMVGSPKALDFLMKGPNGGSTLSINGNVFHHQPQNSTDPVSNAPIPLVWFPPYLEHTETVSMDEPIGIVITLEFMQDPIQETSLLR